MVKRVAEKPNFAAGAQVNGIDIDPAIMAELQTAVATQAAQIQVRQQADAGYSVSTGLIPSANASVIGSISRANAASTFDKTAHLLNIGDTFKFTALGNTTGVTVGVIYYVAATGFTANAFRPAATSGGAALTLAGAVDTATISITRVGMLDVSAGTELIGTTERTIGAVTASSVVGPVAALADATNPKWVLIEETSAGALAVTQGAAGLYPAIPSIPSVSTNVPIALYSIPANAQEIDGLLTTINGKAKLIDIRNTPLNHPSRVLLRDTTGTTKTNPTTYISVLGSTYSVPINSVSVGDIFKMSFSVLTLNNTAASIHNFKVLWGSAIILEWLGQTNVPTGFHWTYIELIVQVTAVGATGSVTVSSQGCISQSTVHTGQELYIGQLGGVSAVTIDTTAAQAIDFQFKFTTGSTGSTALSYNNVIEKKPV